MNVSAVRQSSFEACKATLTGSRPVVTLRIDRLSEVPLPGRAPVTLTLGKDPMGLVPGLTRAVARVRLRFATETGVFSGRVESLVTLEPDEEAMAACDFTIDSLLEELAGVEEAQIAEEAATRGSAQALAETRSPLTRPVIAVSKKGRLGVWFGLFLATVGTWMVQDSNSEAARQDHFNQASLARTQARSISEPKGPRIAITLAGSRQILGELDAELLDAAMLMATEDFVGCYRDIVDGLILPPTGKLGIQLVFGKTGDARSAHISEDTVGSAELQDCVLDTLSDFRGPSLDSGEMAMATYSFAFGVR
jgi:hypothetical protein